MEIGYIPDVLKNGFINMRWFKGKPKASPILGLVGFIKPNDHKAFKHVVAYRCPECSSKVTLYAS
jgi:hypothetical protein